VHKRDKTRNGYFYFQNNFTFHDFIFKQLCVCEHKHPYSWGRHSLIATVSHYVAQPASNTQSCLSLLSTGITGVHHTFNFMIYSWQRIQSHTSYIYVCSCIIEELYGLTILVFMFSFNVEINPYLEVKMSNKVHVWKQSLPPFYCVKL
jgi:hypothetical protein